MAPLVRQLYDEACQRWGREQVNADLTRIWDLRCHWGMSARLPFAALRAGEAR